MSNPRVPHVQAATPGCTKQACAFRDAFGKFTDIGAEVFGISSDDVQKNSEFAKVRLAQMAQESRKALQTPFWRSSCGNESTLAGRVSIGHCVQAQRLPFPLLTDQSEFLRKSFGIKGDLLG